MDDQTLKKTLTTIYERLMACYGPQHWWPAREPFEVIVGAILTQSAAWTNVEKAISNLRTAEVLSPSGLRDLTHEELASLIHSSGYYNVKTKKLQAFVDWLGKQYDDNLETLFTLPADTLREQLLAIYGIGEETADSIILYAAQKPIFVIDAYTRRITSRAGLIPASSSYTTLQELFMQHLTPDTQLFNEYHALLVNLAKNACRPHPLCHQCCLAATHSQDSPDDFPCAKISTDK